MQTKDPHTSGVHWSFWVVAGLALVWNALGSANFLAQLNPETVTSMPEAYRLVIADRPIWATGAFAVAVFGGTLGCLLLLLKKSAAYYLFTASLLGVIVTMIHAVGARTTTVDFTPVFVGTSMSLVVAALLMEYSKWGERKGWIGSPTG